MLQKIISKTDFLKTNMNSSHLLQLECVNVKNKKEIIEFFR